MATLLLPPPIPLLQTGELAPSDAFKRLLLGWHQFAQRSEKGPLGHRRRWKNQEILLLTGGRGKAADGWVLECPDGPLDSTAYGSDFDEGLPDSKSTPAERRLLILRQSCTFDVEEGANRMLYASNNFLYFGLKTDLVQMFLKTNTTLHGYSPAMLTSSNFCALLHCCSLFLIASFFAYFFERELEFHCKVKIF